MSTTITKLPITTAADLSVNDSIDAFVSGYSATWATKNVLHSALNARARTATVNGAGLRSGTLTIVLDTEADKTTAVAILNQPAVFQLSSTDLDSIDMNLVMTGNLIEQLDPETLTAWTVQFDFEEQL